MSCSAPARQARVESLIRYGLVGSCLGLAFLVSLMPAAASAQPPDPQGFIYGKVTTDDATYEGRLRWDDEEAFWGDFFNASKDQRPYLDVVPRDQRRRRNDLQIFGIKINLEHDAYDDGRSLVARFGDLRRIDVRGGDRATLIFKNGSEVEIDGGSNDVDAEIFVWDRKVGEIELDWRRIDSIEFMPTPSDLAVDVFRLYGTVQTRDGDFTGYIQWDQEECLSTDKLDGDTRDDDVSIAMGQIAAIEKRSRSSSRVTLKGGRELTLDGSNDVDDDNRGIFVEDPRYGRVLIGWDAFERVDFSSPPGSGPTYDEFAAAVPLRGKVTTLDGDTHAGRIVYDLDESETWEILNGDRRDISYSIPFALIAAVEPLDADGSRVILLSGDKLELEKAADISEDNDGVLVITTDGKETYVAWRDIERIDFAPSQAASSRADS